MNLRHETFIREMIAHGNRARAYLTAYPALSARAAYNNACRLLAIPHIYTRIRDAVHKLEQEVLHRIEQEKQTTLADTYEKRVLLAAIIHSAFRPEQKETNLYPLETLLKPPTIAQVLRAIVLDTKLEYGWKQKL